MKTSNLIVRATWRLAGFASIVALIGMLSCSDSENAKELTPALKQYLSMRMGSNNAMAESMRGPVNQSFQGLFGQGFRLNGRSDSDSTEVPGDTTIISDPWQSCAVVTITSNPDGSTTTVYDYGTGCEEGGGDYRYVIQGKYTSTYRESYREEGSSYKQSYLYGTTYENYGTYIPGVSFWLLNGGGTYQGESSYNWETGVFSGSYEYDDETTYQFDSTTYFYQAKGRSSYSNENFTVESGDNNYTFGEEFYKSKVLRPLVIDYTCYQQKADGENAEAFLLWVYTSGRERIQYKFGEEEGSFEIDYGDGECDNIVTVYYDGNVTQIDLSKEWVLE